MTAPTRGPLGLLSTVVITLAIGSATLARAERLPIQSYGPAEGLPSTFVQHVMHDSRGFVWFSTRDGISRFDFNLAFGGGLTDNQTSRGLTFSGGLGIKLYFDTWFALRFDVRDQVLQQELLGDSTIVNNITVTLGMSVFIPFTQ